MFQPSDVIVDVFAGVGPFAVPAAKNGCYVLGNDLNPSSSQAMQANAERNKVVLVVDLPPKKKATDGILGSALDSRQLSRRARVHQRIACEDMARAIPTHRQPPSSQTETKSCQACTGRQPVPVRTYP